MAVGCCPNTKGEEVLLAPNGVDPGAGIVLVLFGADGNAGKPLFDAPEAAALAAGAPNSGAFVSNDGAALG